MGVSLGPGGGGGQGGGLLLRSPVDTFNGATRAAAETARDAGITDTTPFDDNPNLAIILTWPVTPTNTVYQVRRGSAWADVTGVVRGPMGSVGSQGRFDVYCYANSITAPSTPTGGTYNLTTGVLTVPTGTTAAPVEPTGNQITWRSQATINPSIQSGSVTPTWTAFTTDVEASLAAQAEAAQLAAEAAQTAAETAQTNAETAETNAETAETGAEAAETAAETAQTRAEAAQSGAETALAGSGAALAFNELWTGDLLLSAANQWHALGTEAVPSNATWLLWNGGTLTDGTNDGPAALWTWINAADWRTLTADTVGTTAGDGTGMLFADWCASDIGDGTPDFTRRDAVIGRTSADIPLLMGPQTGESYFGARLMYITQAVATPGGGGGASSFADLTGMIADSQVPAAFTRDTELAGLVDDITISGTTLTITFQDGSTATRTLPSGGSDIAAQDEGTELTATLATLNFAGEGVTASLSGGIVTVNIPGTGGIPPTHTAEQYLALKSGSDAFTASDFTDADRGVAFGTGSHTATAPNMPSGNVQLGLARLASDPTPIFLDINATGLNQFGALMQQSGTVTISSATYNVWVHENSLPYQGAMVEFR